jgi:isopropylmalate/homocitrate/citramalate synthase
MTGFPKFVEIREEGPREGFQIERQIYPIAQRIELIDMLSDTGLKRIQVGSFVSCGAMSRKWPTPTNCSAASNVRRA